MCKSTPGYVILFEGRYDMNLQDMTENVCLELSELFSIAEDNYNNSDFKL